MFDANSIIYRVKFLEMDLTSTYCSYSPKLNYIFESLKKIRAEMEEAGKKSEAIRSFIFKKCRIFIVNSVVEFEYSMHMVEYFEKLDADEPYKTPILFFFDENPNVPDELDKYRYFCWNSLNPIKGLYPVEFIYQKEGEEPQDLRVYAKDFIGCVLSSFSYHYSHSTFIDIYLNNYNTEDKDIKLNQARLFDMDFFRSSGKDPNTIVGISKDMKSISNFLEIIKAKVSGCCYDGNEIVLEHYEMLIKEIKFWIDRDFNYNVSTTRFMLKKRKEVDEDDDVDEYDD